MSETLRRVQALVLAGDYRVSDHGYEELRKDAIFVSDAAAGITAAEAVEDYRTRDRVLALQHEANGRPIHVVWAISADRRRAVLVTAYRPDPDLWDSDFKERKKR
jgi:uncharacterized protein DUF4258